MDFQSAVVLVAEDDDLIREIVAHSLTSEGFIAIEAENAAEAASILRDEMNKIDVLFTDVRMPGEMDGMALARHTRKHCPWVKVLITSGHERPSQTDLPDQSVFIPKPYRLAEVIKLLKSR